MPAEERRAAIIAATLPLLLAHGVQITTRQIAEAAGIAEGTIFRVFPDKETLIDATVDAALDRAPLEAALAAVDRTLPLEARLARAVELIQRRLADVWQLLSVVGTSKLPDPQHRRRPADLHELAALFEPERHRLWRDPVEAAQLLYGLTMAVSHPALTSRDPLPPDEIVSLVLDGIRHHPEAPSC
jgi:AcrR family transcriptional regulator